jgi:hypothetical protein
MSSPTGPASPNVDDRPTEVVVISHSSLFYWWPVWAVGYLMAALTYLSGYHVAFVPAGTVAQRGAHVKGIDGPRDVLIVPADRSLRTDPESGELEPMRLRMTPNNDLGIIWGLVLCLVVIVTNVPLRGMWSFIVIVVLVFGTILLAVLGLWDRIIDTIRVVDIHLTGYSYLIISTFLFAVWLIAFLFLDRMIYMVFTRGQLRVRMAISQGEQVYDTRGMVVERHRDDLFRHWLLGFGSGDLTVRVGGSSQQQLELPNILSIASKMRLIQTMLQEREVVRASR